MSDLAPPAPERALDHLLPQLYDELRLIARRLLARERDGHTLTPTALLHEAYLRLGNGRGAQAPMDPLHFRALAARVMRHVLVDHALARRGEKLDLLARRLLGIEDFRPWRIRLGRLPIKR